MKASFRKHFILMCRFTILCVRVYGLGVGGGGRTKKERKRVSLQQRNLSEKS